MTVFGCEGFETIGNTGTSGADIETRLNATDKYSKVELSGGFTNPVTLIDDFETVGFALEFDVLDASRGEFIRMEYPDGTGRFSDYKVSTNGSVPVFVTGFRLFNATTDPAQAVTVWRCLQGSGTPLSSVRIDSNGEDITFIPAAGSNVQVTGVLTQDTWHYIEIEYKCTTSGDGGYLKVYVDGVEQLDSGAASVANFTFFTTFGVDVGVLCTTNETGGNQWAIDDIYHLEIDGVDHTAPLGPCRVLRLEPASDATPNDWTPSTGGDNYALIDEEDWGTADYVDAATTGDDDHYLLSTLVGGTVHGVQIDVACIAVDGTPSLHIGFDDGTADEEDMGVIGTGSTENKRMMFEIDPSGAAWTVSSVNAAEATQRMTE